MSIPAVEVGLDLDQRVVRRHVAKLEAAGWLARAPWIWGEGSVVWLTPTGHGVLVGWLAARSSPEARVWKSARELAVERESWAVRARCERGYTELLPHFAVW